jgi:hypothetical protein
MKISLKFADEDLPGTLVPLKKNGNLKNAGCGVST